MRNWLWRAALVAWLIGVPVWMMVLAEEVVAPARPEPPPPSDWQDPVLQRQAAAQATRVRRLEKAQEPAGSGQGARHLRLVQGFVQRDPRQEPRPTPEGGLDAVAWVQDRLPPGCDETACAHVEEVHDPPLILRTGSERLPLSRGYRLGPWLLAGAETRAPGGQGERWLEEGDPVAVLGRLDDEGVLQSEELVRGTAEAWLRWERDRLERLRQVPTARAEHAEAGRPATQDRLARIAQRWPEGLGAFLICLAVALAVRRAVRSKDSQVD